MKYTYLNINKENKLINKQQKYGGAAIANTSLYSLCTYVLHRDLLPYHGEPSESRTCINHIQQVEFIDYQINQ